MYSIYYNKIKEKKARILIIGLGYVGLPLLKLINSKMYKVSGLDLNKMKVASLKNKIKNVNFYSNYNDVQFSKIDIIIITLPTPVHKNQKPDLSFIENCIKKLKKKISSSKIVILESTSYPSTTKEFIVKPFQEKFTIGKNFFVGYSPEREDPGNKSFSIKNIPKITSGHTKNCLNLTSLFYKTICSRVIEASSIETAEMTKIFENIFRAVNIGLVNETKQLAKKLKIDIDEVTNLAKSKPFGFMPFYAGPGVGGHCIPVDPFYLSWLAKKKKIGAKFIYLAGKINSNMPFEISKEIKFFFKKQKKKIL